MIGLAVRIDHAKMHLHRPGTLPWKLFFSVRRPFSSGRRTHPGVNYSRTPFCPFSAEPVHRG